MKKLLFVLLSLFLINTTNAQTKEDKAGVEKACLNYLDGFYEGDTLKLINSLKPRLNKFGYWKNDKTGEYDDAGYMTYDQAIAYAKDVFEKKHFAEADAPKKVEVLDIKNHIAAAKVTAWWGTDYILLSKDEGKWMIEQVIWEGPLEK